MLSDIGLTRSDLRDAYSEPLWRDPTCILASRARERQVNRPVITLAAPSLVPQHGTRLAGEQLAQRYAL